MKLNVFFGRMRYESAIETILAVVQVKNTIIACCALNASQCLAFDLTDGDGDSMSQYSECVLVSVWIYKQIIAPANYTVL